MSLPNISVIIPCYNYARYVGQAIDSVLAQGYPALNLVVVNDGSTDDSLSVIHSHATRANIIDQPNRGQVQARNAGFAASTGDIVLFLDADDLLEPSALMELARAWSPVLAKIQFDLRVIDADGKDLGRRFAYFRPSFTVQRVRDDFARTGTYRWPVTTGNAYAKWFVSLAFPQAFDGPVDGYLNTIAPIYGDVLTLPIPLGRYRLHDRNRSSKTRAASGFADTIARRRRELAEMRRHAMIRGVRIPNGDPLDHELPFLNCRLMAVKLGMNYPGSDRDAGLPLLCKAVRQLWQEGLPAKITAMHALWFLVLAFVPRTFVSPLIRLRFERAQLLRSWRQRLSGISTRGA
jgi:glycosyltransferase involved in cell wall biosynthesis